MVKLKKLKGLFFTAILFFLFANAQSFAKELLVDEAGVLSTDSFNKISGLLNEFSKKAGMDAVVVIVKNSGEKSPEAFADDYFDYNDYGVGSGHEGCLFLIITGDENQDRYCHISTTGPKTIKTLTDSRINKLSDTAIDGGLKENLYEKGIISYIQKLDSYFLNKLTLVEILIGLGSALFVFIISYNSIKSKYKMQPMNAVYDVSLNAVSNLTVPKDILLSSDTVSHIIKKESGNSQSSTHTSSSGRTHGGGGKSY